jgi:6-pyruvoyltetrahydropterin/6-carboxytetrahydropterin synthase
MGHRISKHQGKCYSLHGHSYFCKVFLNSTDVNANGMVLDFYELDLVMKPIVEELDHSCMVYKEDKFLSVVMSPEHTRLAGERLMKVVWVDFETTAENIAKYLYDRLREKLNCVHEVCVWETQKGMASYKVNEA